MRKRSEEPLRADRRDDDDRSEDSDEQDDVGGRGQETAMTALSPSAIANHIQKLQDRKPASSDEELAPINVGPTGDASKEKELKLPDFFSKAALEKGSAKNSVKGLQAVDAKAQLAAMKDNEGLSRQEAMEKFVTKMNELGIPPEKLLAAFSKLDDKAMQAAPEASMGQFLKALDLNGQDEAKAGVLYKDLLKTTGDSLVNERLAGLESGVNFDVMSPRDASLKKLSNSLDDMNKSFFRKEDPKQASKDLESMDVALAKLMKQPVDAQGAATVAPNATLPDANAQATQADAQALAGLIAANGQPTALATNTESGEGDLADLLAGKGADIPAKSGKEALKSAFAEELATTEKSAGKDDDGDLKAEVKGDGALKGDPSQVMGKDTPSLTPTAKSLMGPSDMMLNRQASAQDEQDNVKDLIRQAQVLVKRGGGEMKMEMKPEGMGSIQLRVNVENGQVNVQMLTESESAKHLLEKGLSELKSNLAQHELKVQSLTVDVGNDTKTQMDQKASQDQARQHARQFASDFMQDFRDNNQGFRQGLADNKGWKSYSRNKGPDSIQPEQVARAASAMRSDNSKRLNLVA